MSHCISSMTSSGIGVHATESQHLNGGGRATTCTLKQRMAHVLFGYRPKLSTADLSWHGWQKLSIIWVERLGLNPNEYFWNPNPVAWSWTNPYFSQDALQKAELLSRTDGESDADFMARKQLWGLGIMTVTLGILKVCISILCPYFGGYRIHMNSWWHRCFAPNVHPSQDFIGWVAKDDWRIS